MSDEVSGLPEAMALKWRKSELKKWLQDYADDCSRWDICLFDSPSRRTIDMYTYPPDGVGILFEPEADGWRGTPYVDEGATPAAVEKLRQWCEALIRYSISPAADDPTALGTRAKALGIRPNTLQRWDLIRTKYQPQGFTQATIAELCAVDAQVIKKDYRRMREKGLLPPK